MQIINLLKAHSAVRRLFAKRCLYVFIRRDNAGFWINNDKHNEI